jgi:hypothetical protein
VESASAVRLRSWCSLNRAKNYTAGAIPRWGRTNSDRPVNGMQKHGLTMFARTCYSSLVPRVHPGLLCAASFSAMCRDLAVELLRKTFPDGVQVRKLSSLKRSCGAFCPIVEGYAGQG